MNSTDPRALDPDATRHEVPTVHRSPSAARIAGRIPTDRWLLLVLALGTCVFCVRNGFSQPAPSHPAGPRAAMTPLTPSPSATTSRFAFEPTPETQAAMTAPHDPAALETAAARAWLAGHNAEAARLYEQLATLSPQAPHYAAAVAVLRSETHPKSVESNP